MNTTKVNFIEPQMYSSRPKYFTGRRLSTRTMGMKISMTTPGDMSGEKESVSLGYPAALRRSGG
jgi:hypothetical protein